MERIAAESSINTFLKISGQMAAACGSQRFRTIGQRETANLAVEISNPLSYAITDDGRQILQRPSSKG
jgi:hypothetical protein